MFSNPYTSFKLDTNALHILVRPEPLKPYKIIERGNNFLNAGANKFV